MKNINDFSEYKPGVADQLYDIIEDAHYERQNRNQMN